MPQLGKYIVLVTALPRRWTFALAPLHWTWVYNCKGAPALLNNFSVCQSCETTEFKPHWLSSQVIQGPIPWAAAEKLRCQACVQALSREILAAGSGKNMEVVSAGSLCLWEGLWSAPGHLLNQRPDPQAVTFKVCKQASFRKRLQDMHFCPVFSELGIWGAHPSDGGLKIRDAGSGVHTLHFSERSLEFRVPSCLYGTVSRVGFMERM